MLLLALLVVAFFILLVGARSIKTQIDLLAFASSDNLGWNLSQLDVDYRGMTIKMLEPITPGSPAGVEVTAEEFENIQRGFDIFYSRVKVVGATFTRVGVTDAIQEDFEKIVIARNEMADLIDAMDTPTTAQIKELCDLANALGTQVRSLSTKGIQRLSQIQSGAREAQHSAFLRFHGTSFVILGFVLISCLLALFLWRDLEKRSAQVARAATNVTNAVNAANSAVIFTDRSGRITQCNEAAAHYFGGDREDLVEIDFIHALLDQSSLSSFLLHRDRPKSETIQLMARRSDNQAFPVEMSGVWQKDAEDEDIYIIYLTDISERLEAETKLKASRDEAKEASEAKSRFLATMSHEMRTPLHGVIASLDMIDTKHLIDADRELFETACECSNRALEQVNSILDHTRLIQTKEKPLPVTLSRVVKDIQHALIPLAAANNNTLSVEFLGDGVDASYHTLPDAFSRVMYNLIGNAIKFTQDGTVKVEMIATRGKTANTRQLNFIVRDDGIGIQEKDQARIFESFEKAKFNEDDSTKGTGLGLSIVKHSLAQMNSKIALQSTFGKGSSFRFTLELEMVPGTAPAEVATTKAFPAPIAQDATIHNATAPVLIVDDNPINRTVLREMVSRLGYTPVCVTLGLEAVATAQDTYYSLILMDVNMPGMDGHEATREIRSGQGISANTTILGVTALISRDYNQKSESGMNAMLAKPLTASRLTAAIKEHVDAETHQSADHEDITDLMDPVTARELKLQSLTDARTALRILSDPTSTWTARLDAAHYAVGSTGIVGFIKLSQMLSEAEAAAKQQDQSALDNSVATLQETLAE
ncbi:MAG: ATP-binding protein [Planktotalea arctica]